MAFIVSKEYFSEICHEYKILNHNVMDIIYHYYYELEEFSREINMHFNEFCIHLDNEGSIYQNDISKIFKLLYNDYQNNENYDFNSRIDYILNNFIINYIHLKTLRYSIENYGYFNAIREYNYNCNDFNYILDLPEREILKHLYYNILSKKILEMISLDDIINFQILKDL
tara:strand:+ start:3667 stop:4176 length:510 start_codon:yes stop_codon:yes gene_type:complete